MQVATRRIPYEREVLSNVVSAVAHGGKRPPVPPGCSSHLAATMQQSWTEEPGDRPTFSELEAHVKKK